ncbi:DUF6252 family protein [Formosa sp. PL04]|uniref:DUF6252 family protein n=1 Tax=Formosa sp. PL04 TaxID=3081755 RepID=UPI002981E1CC|nr:DUF6252 family protein [Formosa sp. PL04]MDW5287304.1 DUF6252 family protein [Formosa sp. PL04]
MRTCCTVFLVCLLFTACGDDVEFNYPAFQASKDGVLWKSLSQEAISTSGILTISSRVNAEIITLEITNSTGLDTLGVAKTSKAIYKDAEGTIYSTLYSAVDNPETPNIDESLVSYSEGEVNIIEINNSEGYVSGEFWFTAYDSTGVNKVNFNQGVFYQVPLVTE